MLRYGIEMEVVGMGCAAVFDGINRLLPEYNFLLCHNEGWNVGVDRSMGEIGAEVRSPIMVGDYSKVFKVVAALRTIKCRVNQKCGFHVHVSDTSDCILNSDEIEKIFIELFKTKMGYTSRVREFCSFRKHKTCDKYRAVRQVTGTHVEFRMFNMTLNSHGVSNYLQQVSRTVQNYLLSTGSAP